MPRDVVLVSGSDAASFLQGQLSQDIGPLALGATCWSFLLEPTGRVTALLRATRTDEGFLLDVDAGFGAAVHARLARFLLRVDVVLDAQRWSMAALRGPGAASVAVPSGVLALEPGWIGVEGIDLLAEAILLPDRVPAVDAADLEALRIEAGVPALGAEITEATIPAEAGAGLIERTVSFTKGCFTGQELVARIDSRGGNVPHPVRALVLAGPVAVGDEVILDGAPIGHVTSTAVSPQLGAIALAVVGRAVVAGTVGVAVASAAGAVAAEVRETPLQGS